MAHECPNCYQVCFCGGDIDDLLLNREQDVIWCRHYEQCEFEEEDDGTRV